MERSLWEFFVDHRPEWLVSAAKFMAFVGDETVLLPATLLLATGALYRRRATLATLAPFASMFATYFVVGIMKLLFNRSRPPVADRLVEASTASMPSGHAAYAACLAMVVWLLVDGRPGAARWRSVAVLLAGAAGASRLVLGVHWASDVAVGWIVGDLVALGVVAALSRRLQSAV